MKSLICVCVCVCVLNNYIICFIVICRLLNNGVDSSQGMSHVSSQYTYSAFEDLLESTERKSILDIHNGVKVISIMKIVLMSLNYADSVLILFI